MLTAYLQQNSKSLINAASFIKQVEPVMIYPTQVEPEPNSFLLFYFTASGERGINITCNVRHIRYFCVSNYSKMYQK